MRGIERVYPLSDNVVHARHDADVACDGCSASSYLCKFIKNVLEKGEHLLQSGMLNLHIMLKLIVINRVELW